MLYHLANPEEVRENPLYKSLFQYYVHHSYDFILCLLWHWDEPYMVLLKNYIFYIKKRGGEFIQPPHSFIISVPSRHLNKQLIKFRLF